MTYIKLTNDMDLVVTVADTIYRGDNLSKAITFLVPTNIGGLDMATATIFLSYIRADGEPDMVILEKSSNYNESYCQYVLPVTCKLSRYPGSICMWLQIVSGYSGNPTVAKSGECTIRIQESKNMDDYLCDHQLLALYQMKQKIDGMSGSGGGENWDDMTDKPEDSGTNTPTTPEKPDEEGSGDIYWEDM